MTNAKLRVVCLFAFLLLLSCKEHVITVDEYLETRFRELANSSSKIVTTRYYEGVEYQGKWICGKELDFLSGYMDEPSSMKVYNQAGNLTVDVSLEVLRKITEYVYVTPSSSDIAEERHLVQYPDEHFDYTLYYIRDSTGVLLSVENAKGEKDRWYEYDTNKVIEHNGDERIEWKRNPGDTEVHSILTYGRMVEGQDGSYEYYENYVSKEELVIYDESGNLSSDRIKYYSGESPSGNVSATEDTSYSYKDGKLSSVVVVKNSFHEWDSYDRYTTSFLSYNEHGDPVSEERHIVSTNENREVRYPSKVHRDEKTLFFKDEYTYNEHGEWIQRIEIAEHRALPVIITVREITYQ